MMPLYRKTFAEISIKNLIHNWDLLKKWNGDGNFICPMVKANAYGHGDVIVAKALENYGAQNLGVCLIEEGLWLRQAGVKSNIFIFRGFDQEGAFEIVNSCFTPIVSQWEHLDYLEKASQNQSISIHIKFDTGMNRLGFSIKEVSKLDDYLWQNKKIRLKGVLTHLHSAEDAFVQEGATHHQCTEFKKIQRVFKKYSPFFHVFNSGALLAKSLQRPEFSLDDSQSNWGSRPGLALYGYAPELSQAVGLEWGLKPVMTLKSHISDLKFVSKGEGVSYSHLWKAKTDSVIAVVPIGYADGFSRRLSNEAKVCVMGQLAPVVGNICMDYLMIDVTRLMDKKIEKGESVILFGGREDTIKPQSAADLAKLQKTIPWEILTSIGIRVPRLVI